jgi:hypothetical protein
MNISGNFDKTVISYKQIFLFQTITSVARAAGVTPLRVSKPTMYMQQSQAYFVATLLDKAPSISNSILFLSDFLTVLNT